MSFLQRICRYLKIAWIGVGALIILAVLGNYLCYPALKLIPTKISSLNLESTRESAIWDTYPDDFDVDELIEATDSYKMSPFSFTLVKGEPLRSKYVNVEKNKFRTRKTIKDPSSNAKKVFMFGGSTLWGLGVPDEATITSLLQKKLGDGYDLTNYGEKGFHSTTELHLLIEVIEQEGTPDIVIFYDGFNDTLWSLLFKNLRKSFFEATLRQIWRNPWFFLFSKTDTGWFRLFQKIQLLSNNSLMNKFAKNAKKRWHQSTESVIDNYEKHIRHVKALEEEYGFETFFFWQPHLLATSHQRLNFAYERKIIEYSGIAKLENPSNEANKMFKNNFSNRELENVFYIGEILDNINEVVYLDLCHLSPHGNDIVAQKIYDSISK